MTAHTAHWQEWFLDTLASPAWERIRSASGADLRELTLIMAALIRYGARHAGVVAAFPASELEAHFRLTPGRAVRVLALMREAGLIRNEYLSDWQALVARGIVPDYQPAAPATERSRRARQRKRLRAVRQMEASQAMAAPANLIAGQQGAITATASAAGEVISATPEAEKATSGQPCATLPGKNATLEAIGATPEAGAATLAGPSATPGRDNATLAAGSVAEVSIDARARKGDQDGYFKNIKNNDFKFNNINLNNINLKYNKPAGCNASECNASGGNVAGGMVAAGEICGQDKLAVGGMAGGIAQEASPAGAEARRQAGAVGLAPRSTCNIYGMADGVSAKRNPCGCNAATGDATGCNAVKANAIGGNAAGGKVADDDVTGRKVAGAGTGQGNACGRGHAAGSAAQDAGLAGGTDGRKDAAREFLAMAGLVGKASACASLTRPRQPASQAGQVAGGGAARRKKS